MKQKLSIVIGVCLIVISIAAGCTSQAVEPTQVPTIAPTKAQPTIEPTEIAKLEPEPIVIVDDLGAELILPEPAQRIISISPSLTEILFGVGAGERLIGRDSNSMYPEAALAAVDLGGMWDGIPVEDILAMEPDLIMAGEIFSAEAIAELRDLGLTVYWQGNPDSFEGLFENIRDISILTGTEEQAELLIQDLSSRVETLKLELADVEENPLVFYELDASDPANPWTTGAGTFISYVINLAKGQNLGDSLEGEWVQISSEALIVQNPDIIFLADALYGITPESVAERAGWSEINAIKTGNIFPFDPFILSVPGPRLVDGFEQMVLILHPEIGE
jgi:iron complex transport system substrate-binding protein